MTHTQLRFSLALHPTVYNVGLAPFLLHSYLKVSPYRTAVAVKSPEIARASLHVARPFWTHIYAVPFLCLYPLWAYAYYFKYDDWIKSEEWTFLGSVLLGAGHALSFLATRWSAGAKALITSRTVRGTYARNALDITYTLT